MLPWPDLRQVALRDAGGERERLAGHGVLGTPGPHALAEAGEIGGFGVVFALRRRQESGHMHYSA
jgi:hypothetical protein